MTTLFYTVESRLWEDSHGAVRSEKVDNWYAAYAEWLGPVDQVVVIARVRHEDRSEGGLVEGPGVSVWRVPYYRGLSGLAVALPGVIRAFAQLPRGPKVVYGGRFPGVLSTAIYGAAIVRRVRLLANVVGDPDAVLEAGVGGAIGRALRPLARSLFRDEVRRASAVRYVSQRYLQEKYPPTEGVPCISMSNVRLREGDLLPPEGRRRCNHQGPLHIVTSGSQDQRYKGHDVLIRALAIIVGKGLDVELSILGAGRYQPELKALARALHVAERVKFLGHVSDRSTYRSVLDESDLFVMPSRTEGVPRALIEAMARSLPCAGSTVGGIPELIRDECTFPADDPEATARVVGGILRDADLCHTLSEENFAAAHRLAKQTRPERFREFLTEVTMLPVASQPHPG